MLYTRNQLNSLLNSSDLETCLRLEIASVQRSDRAKCIENENE